jgi:hypothetical protein
MVAYSRRLVKGRRFRFGYLLLILLLGDNNMKITEATITDFYFIPGHPRDKVKAMVDVKLEGVSNRHMTWIKLTSEETQTVLKLAHLIEQRILSDCPELSEL